MRTRYTAWLTLAVALLSAPTAAQNYATNAGQLTAANQSVSVNVGGLATGAITVLGTFTGTVTFRVRDQSGEAIAVRCTPPNSTTAATTATAAGSWGSCNVAGYAVFEAVMTSYTSGTAQITISAQISGGGGGSGTLDLTGSTFSGNLAASATGAAVPANADYLGVNSGGNLVGISFGQATMANSLPVAIASNQSTLAVSAATLPLPTGAATAAKQPALGTAGTASADAITVQGIASMTPLLATLSGTNNLNNISGTISLPTGASTAAKQPALGTAGTASSDVISVQGIASMTPFNVTLGAETTKVIGVVRTADGSGNLLASNANSGTRALAAVIYDGSGNAITAFSGSGGTSSNYTSAFPSAGTAAGFSDGTNMQGARVVDADTGAGTIYTLTTNSVFRASGTPVEAGTSTNPWNVVFPSAQAVTQSGTWNVGTITAVTSITNAVTAVGAAASGAAKSGNPVQVGGVFNTTQPTVTNGQAVEAQATARGGQIVATGADTFNVTVNAALPAGTNVIGHTITDSGTITAVTSITNPVTVTDGAGALNVIVDSITAGNNNIGDVDVASIAAGDNDIGNVDLEFAGTAASTGNGASGAQTLRVTLANDSTGIVALTTSTASIGKLAANSGVDIGDIDVTSIIPGTGATNLGKAEDAAHASADVGVAIFCVRRDTTPSSSSGNAADYSTCNTDANGRLYTNDSAYTPNGDSAMDDTANAMKVLLVDSTGATATLASDYSQGSTTSGQLGPLIQGAVTTSAPTYTSGQTSPLSLDTSGSVRVAVVSGSTGNAAASNTGSAVPTQADYNGINVAGTLRGQTGVNPSGTIYAGQVDIAAVAGATAAVNNGAVDAGTMRVTLANNSSGNIATIGTSITPGTAVTNLGKAEDQASADGDVGVTLLARRTATPANTSGADLDYEALQMAAGRLWTSGVVTDLVPGVAATNLAKAEDAGHSSSDVGVMMLCVSKTSATDLSAGATDGDYEPCEVDRNGRMLVSALIESASVAVTGVTVTDGAAGTFAPVLTGGRASAAAPTDVSADGDAVPAWLLRSGATATQQTYAGVLAVAGNGASGTGVQRVTIANDSTGIIALTTGSAQIGHLEANQSSNVAQINGVTPLMGNGASGTGAQRVTLANDSTGILATVTTVGTVTTLSQLGGVALPIEDAPETAAGVGIYAMGVRRDVAAASAGTTGDNTMASYTALGAQWTATIDPCSSMKKIHVAINQTTGTQLLTGTASNRTYICHIDLVTATAQNIALVSGTGTVCATSLGPMLGGTTAATGWNFAANGGIVLGDGTGAITQTDTDADNVCLLTSSTGQISGGISYVVAPN